MTSVTQNPENKALVLFSGGQDSTVCLAWALDRYTHVETVGFDYGQRHATELACRADILKVLPEQFPLWAPRLGPDHLLAIPVLGEISDTALTREAEITIDANGLPATFVPGRNLLFFTLAAALGYRRGILHLIGGMCETDYSGYPDCRQDTLTTMQTALRLGTEADFTLVTPLMRTSKAETWAMAQAFGGAAMLELVLERTHTCYLGERGTRHQWGYGCGTCPACQLRAKGYAEFLAL
jgi:7-cyano-7-deazaguanine synthase